MMAELSSQSCRLNPEIIFQMLMLTQLADMMLWRQVKDVKQA